jgi:hypothetical protein
MLFPMGFPVYAERGVQVAAMTLKVYETNRRVLLKLFNLETRETRAG